MDLSEDKNRLLRSKEGLHIELDVLHLGAKKRVMSKNVYHVQHPNTYGSQDNIKTTIHTPDNLESPTNLEREASGMSKWPEPEPRHLKLEPVQIIDLILKGQSNTETRSVLKEDNLAQILKNVGNRRVSLLSIAGPSRQGKSFILSYVIKYLHHISQGAHSADWMGENESEREAPLQKEFSWRGNGVEREMTGMNMWSESFTLTSKNGSELDVLLLDPWVRLMPMNPNDSAKPFRSLTFLIRDWNNASECSYGASGGDNFLKYELSQKHTESVAKIREQIKNSFEQLHCFLMAGPGENVKDIKYDGSVAGMAPNFASSIKEFIESLFDPNTFPLMTISGNPVTGLDLLTYFKKYVEIFNSDKLPSSEDMNRAMTNICNQTIVIKCVAAYETQFEELKSKIRRSFLLEKELQEFHSSAVKEALFTFDKSVKFMFLKYHKSQECAQIRKQIQHNFEQLHCILFPVAGENLVDINYNDSVAWMTHNFVPSVKNGVKVFQKYWSESEKGALNTFESIFLSKLSYLEGKRRERITRYTKIIGDSATKKDAALQLEQRLQIILVFNNSVQAYETKLKKISKLSKTEAEFMKQAWMAITEIFEGFKVESELSPSKCSELKIELEKKREEELENLLIRLQKEEAELKNRVREILKNSVEAFEMQLKEISKLSRTVAEFNQKSLGTIIEILKGKEDEAVLSTRECSELKMKLEEKREEELENLRTRFQKEEAELKSSVGGILKKSADAYYTKMKEIAKLSDGEVEFNEKALAAIQEILEDFKVQSELSTSQPFKLLKTKREMKRKQDSENVLNISHLEEPEPKRCFSMA